MTIRRSIVWIPVVLVLYSACSAAVDDQNHTMDGSESSGGKTGGEKSDDDEDAVASDGDTGGSSSASEWESLSGPQPGPHEVWTHACESQLISQEFRVVPLVLCGDAPDFDLETNHSIECWIQDYCQLAEDCTEEARGRCEGVLPSAQCVYPDQGSEACASDADCTTRAGGACNIVPAGTVARQCYPTGECSERGSHCSYPLVHCNTETDCDDGGECFRSIYNAQCRYNTCTSNADCAEDQRCGCSTCVEAFCSADADCDSGESCVLALRCGVAQGYYCTTPQDECTAGEGECIYLEDRWRRGGTCR